MTKKTFVANWKMQLSFHDALDIFKNNIERLDTLSRLPRTELVICPTFTELYSAALLTSDTRIHIGAQNVSSFAQGAYTGQVCATSLAEIGCTYCIVGHSESREFLHETNDDIAKKCTQLFYQGITPIICIGESQETHQQKKTLAYLEQQLEPIFQAIDQTDAKQEYVIAYEPVWAIGSGNIPAIEELETIFVHLYTICKTYPHTFKLLYGGSVHPENAHKLLTIKHINGLLIGGASLHVDSLEALIRNA